MVAAAPAAATRSQGPADDPGRLCRPAILAAEIWQWTPFMMLILLAVVVHAYAAFWVKGTIRAMTRGTVTQGWARANHPLWYRRVRSGGQ